jgi:type II secretory pathway pseudopilin PulG
MRSGRSKQGGFTYVLLLIAVGITGAALAAAGELYSHVAQREKERELLFVGNQYRQAIAAYYAKTPGGAGRYPKKLEDLLEDKRYPMAQRHLRKLYRDPMTGSTDWGLIDAPGGGVMGVFTKSEEQPIKSAGFTLRDRDFGSAKQYSEWLFFHSPTGLGSPR